MATSAEIKRASMYDSGLVMTQSSAMFKSNLKVISTGAPALKITLPASPSLK